jgi:S-adenosylmethionine decarboxylase
VVPTVKIDATSPGSLVGSEWVVEALGCDPERLRDLPRLRMTCEQILRDLDLHPLGEPQWHRFAFPGGVTGLYLLTESHLACHTYPEHALATFNLYCCRPRPRWPWEERLGEMLDAARVLVRSLERGCQYPDHERGCVSYLFSRDAESAERSADTHPEAQP